MKTIIGFFFLFLTSSIVIGETYIGGMYGYSNLNYDINGETWKYLATDRTAAQINSVVRTLDGSIDVNSNKGSPFAKVFIGHRFNRYWGIEAFYVKMAGYSVEGTANARVDPAYANQNKYGNVSLSAYGKVNARANASADFSGYGLRFNGYIPVSKDFDVFGGLGVMSATSNIKTSYNVDANWTYNAEANVGDAGVSTYDQGAYNVNDSDAYSITGYVPVISLGVIYGLTENIGLRAEAELYGVPIDGSSISVLSAGIQYSF